MQEIFVKILFWQTLKHHRFICNEMKTTGLSPTCTPDELVTNEVKMGYVSSSTLTTLPTPNLTVALLTMPKATNTHLELPAAVSSGSTGPSKVLKSVALLFKRSSKKFISVYRRSHLKSGQPCSLHRKRMKQLHLKWPTDFPLVAFSPSQGATLNKFSSKL